MAGAQVKRVLIEEGQAAGVIVVDREDGTVHEIRASYVVVAADALRTPQLLFASGVRLPALGRYLNDQTQVLFAARLADLDPSDAATEAAGGAPSGAIVAQSGVSWVPYTDAEPFHGQVMQLDASPIPIVGDDVPIPGTVVGLGWFCAKDLREEDRLEFDAELEDEWGQPHTRIHYRLTERDHETIGQAKVQIRRAAEALGPVIGDEPLVLAPGASLHYQGTTRMGVADDGSSVCGPSSEVWKTAGLFVAGNNVIPTAIACNPTLTSVALAVAGAREIAGRLRAATGEGA
jgi:choline dehydrogenase-like flavoprotein